MFKIDVRNLVRNKFQIADRLHISPIDIDKMFYYEYEYFIEDLQERLKEESEDNKKQNKEMDDIKNTSNFNPSKIAYGYKTPKLGNYNLPKFK